MWLGFSAAFIGILYALIKFLTIFRLRRLREDLLQVQHEVQKGHLHLEALNEKLNLEQSKKRTLQRETTDLNKTKQRLHARLQALLPNNLQPRLEKCLSLYAEPTSGELKLLQDLDLVKEITRALGPLSLLMLHLPEEDEDQTAALIHLTQLLTIAEVHFHGPQDETIICFFTRPSTAFDFLRRFLQETPDEFVQALRGGLHSGLEITDEKGEINRLLARNLKQTRQLLEDASPGSLLMNEEAYQGLESCDGIQQFDAKHQLYSFTWSTEEGES